MHDYKIYLPHHRDRNSSDDSWCTTAVSVLLLILLMGIVTFYWFDALDVTAANQQYYSKPVEQVES